MPDFLPCTHYNILFSRQNRAQKCLMIGICKNVRKKSKKVPTLKIPTLFIIYYINVIYNPDIRHRPQSNIVGSGFFFLHRFFDFVRSYTIRKSLTRYRHSLFRQTRRVGEWNVCARTNRVSLQDHEYNNTYIPRSVSGDGPWKLDFASSSKRTLITGRPKKSASPWRRL